MSQAEAKLTVAVSRPMVQAVDEAARELSITRSDMVRHALKSFLSERENDRLTKEFARGYAGMSARELREQEQIAEEGQADAEEALRTVIGDEDEGEWW